MKGFFSQLFAEPGNGKPSSTRVLSALVCVLVMGVWAEVSVKKNELQPLSGEQVAMVIGAMGLKVWQRGREEKSQIPNTKSQ